MKRRKNKNKHVFELFQMITVFITLFIFVKTKSIAMAGGVGAAVFIISIGIMIILQLQKQQKLAKSGIDEIDKMEGIEFEYYLKELFKSQGYKAEVTKARGDFGADLILIRDNKKIVVQAKRYKNNVGIKAIQEIHGAVAHYNATEAWVVTNSYFTKPAEKLASTANVKLVDRTAFIEMVHKMNPIDIPNPKSIRNSISPQVKKCAKCGSEMIIRSGAKGQFYGCKGYPKCRHTVQF